MNQRRPASRLRPGEDAPPLLSHPNLAADAHGAIGDVAAGFAQADAVCGGEYASQRVQHAHLETHGTLGRALVTRSRLLVLDESTAGHSALDHQGYRGRDLCDDYAVMGRGRVVDAGPCATMDEAQVLRWLSV